ncbi:MAG: hypothetical protein QOI48_2459 [Solirubrobacteraceae bacterium]|nr:hypothetical protein [Solirubrobacteraceae bacterium]
MLRCCILLMLALGAGAFAPAGAAGAIVVEGEATERSNIPIARHRAASGGAYLKLATVDDPRREGWYASYAVNAPVDGPYRLAAVVMAPAMPDREELGGSFFELAVDDGPFEQVAKSEPVWSAMPSAWGALVRATLDDVELERGVNRITFRVSELRVGARPIGYHFALDRFTLTPTALALKDVSAGELGVTADEQPVLRFTLNAHAAVTQTVRYTVSDYFGNHAASGAATIAAGASAATAQLPALPPGHYRVRTSLASSPQTTFASSFARLPDRRPVRGPANRFGVTVSSPWLVPPARRAAVASAMMQMGAGYVRDEIDWRAIEPRRGAYDTRGVDAAARGYRSAGLKTLGALWALPGNLSAPGWATTKASAPMPDDLRDGYRLARHLAGRGHGVGRDALEVWNEPDVDVLSLRATSKADRHAAYVKAATLGITDRPRRPLAALSGIAFPDEFQDVLLQNGVARYADVWAFHGYGEKYVPSGLSPISKHSVIEHRLRRLYGAHTRMWMTEAGLFMPRTAPNPTRAQQADQARYLVQSTVHDLATGTDKHFWFSGPPYGSCASDFGCFGLFGSDFRPWASYSAHAAMASLLGQANFAHRQRGLPNNVHGAVFKDRRRAITVVWADRPTTVDVPVRGGTVQMYDIMGVHRATRPTRDGGVRVIASLDPQYLVTDGGRGLRARPPANDERRTRARRLSAAEHIVLDQRFLANAEPHGPRSGYRLGARTRMTLAVYNFDERTHAVRVAAHAFGGWTATPSGPTRVRVAPQGRVLIPFTIQAGKRVRTAIDYPLVFEATLGARPVPPSVARIVRTGKQSKPLRLMPSITRVSATACTLRATIRDELSGVDPRLIGVEVDGRRVAARFDPATGRLTSALDLPAGRHEVWIRAQNRAHAPAQRSIEAIGGRGGKSIQRASGRARCAQQA